MNDVWQVQEAKNRFSEVIDRALQQGPQVVTRHGKPVVQVVAVSGAAPAVRAEDGFASYLLAAPRGEALVPAVRRSRRAAPELGG